MSNEPKILPLKRFLYHICQENHPDRRFCFILGAGASVESGIKSGATLVDEWMKVIRDIYSKEEVRQWQAEYNIDDNDPAASYANIFDKRFELDKTIGFNELEKAMEEAEPSCGYSVLAHILANSKNNTVITTNFDSLTEDALFIYTQKKPLVVSHEALAQYINPLSERPVVIKIHRDLLLSPKNSGNEVHKLADGFKAKLQTILQNYTPVVIGYGGNDGSLMGLLEMMHQIPGGIFWCYRPDDIEKPEQHGLNNRILDLVKQHKGCVVPIPGFDSLLIQMGDQLGYGRFDGEIIKIAKNRADNYRAQIENLTKKNSTTEDTKSALSSITAKGDKDLWYYDQLANAEKDLEKKEQIYLQGLDELTEEQSIELQHNYAYFLHYTKEDYDKAERYYERVLNVIPSHEYVNNNYANLLRDIRKDYDKAETYYLKALKVNAEDVYANRNYADFLADIRKDYDKAEKYYLKALKIEPSYVAANNGYADLLTDIRKDYDEAEKHYLTALGTEPDNVYVNNSYAMFLTDIRKEYEQAESYFKVALQQSTDDAHINGNYAKHLITQHRLIDAKNYINTAFELNTDDLASLDLELHFYRYVCFYDEYPEAKSNVESLLEEGIRSPGWHLDNVVEVAKSLNHPEIEEVKRLAAQISEVGLV